jgi:hypothetical protein
MGVVVAMIKFKTLADAVRLAEAAHYSQVDKAGLPYIEHPRRVMQKVQAQGALPYVQIAAILHDVTEDTAYTPEMLLGLGFSEAAVDIVKLLDRAHSKRKWQSLVEAREHLVVSWSGLDDDHYTQVMGDWVDKNLGGREGLNDHNFFYYWDISNNPGAKIVKNADIDDNMEPWRQSYLSDETQERLIIKYTKAREIINA